jgi:spore coat protein CotF
MSTMHRQGPGQGQGGGNMDDKTIVDDCLSTQKFLASTQNTYAGEASSNELRSDLLNILNEEQQLQAQLFQAASQRGWYSPKRANEQEIAQVQSKFRSMQ